MPGIPHVALTENGRSLVGQSPALDIAVSHEWNATAGLERWGKNGVYAAQPFGTADGVGGYFGSQVFGSADDDGATLFSVWDKDLNKVNDDDDFIGFATTPATEEVPEAGVGDPTAVRY